MRSDKTEGTFRNVAANEGTPGSSSGLARRLTRSLAFAPLRPVCNRQVADAGPHSYHFPLLTGFDLPLPSLITAGFGIPTGASSCCAPKPFSLSVSFTDFTPL